MIKDNEKGHTKEPEEYTISPYAKLTILHFKSAKEKLLAMSTDKKLNRMKVGTCHNFFVIFMIYRNGENNFDVDEFVYKYERNFEDEEIIEIKEINHKDLIVDDVIPIVGEHNIMDHEMFEIASETVHYKS